MASSSAFPPRPQYKVPTSVFSVSDDELVVAEQLEREIRRVVDAPDYNPPMLPRAAMEIMELSRREEVSFSAVEAAMVKDPSLTLRVVRTAQSPLFSGSARITSIKDALVRLGAKGLRDVVMAEAMRMRVFRGGPFQPTIEALGRHSHAVAVAARLVCRYTSLSGDYAFLIGLLHDIGVGAAITAAVDSGMKLPSLQVVAAACRPVHEELGARLAKTWSVPDEVRMIIEHHHDPNIQGYAHPLACAVVVAESVVVEPKYKIDGFDGGGRLAPFAMKQLGLEDRQLDLIRKDLGEALASVG
jgi:putative nucleotidyltransferase with HDIG domain